MLKIVEKLNYDYYNQASKNLFSHNGLKDKLLPLECEQEDEDMLYHANFFTRGPCSFFLSSPNICHLNKLSTTLYNYYLKEHKDIIVIPYDATIDSYTRLDPVFTMYVVKMLEKLLDAKEIAQYKKDAENDNVYGLTEELNLAAYFRHIITMINEKKIKVLFIVNNAHLVNRIVMNFLYNRRETFVRFLLTTDFNPKDERDAAKVIKFDNKFNDIYVRGPYILNALEKKLGLLDRKRFIDTYKRFDISYIDVLINIINNLDDEKEIKKIIVNKDKIDDALGFMDLLIRTTPEEYKCYSILPFIYASPLGINQNLLEKIFASYSDPRVRDNIANLIKMLPSIIYQDSENNYRLYENVFINEIGDIYAFDIFHAANILCHNIKILNKKDMSFAINFLYYHFKANDKNGLNLFIQEYQEDPHLFVMSIIYLLSIYKEKARDYLRTYLHLIDDATLYYLMEHLYVTSIEMDVESEYVLALLDRIREVYEDRFSSNITKEQLNLLFLVFYYVGEMEGDLDHPINKIMYHFHALIYSNEYLRLYGADLMEMSNKEQAELALEYTRKIVNDKIDKKVRIPLYDEYDSYELRIYNYIQKDELYNAKVLFLEMLNSYSYNDKDHTADIIDIYQAFNFHLEINDSLMFYYLHLLTKDKSIDNNKVMNFISRRYSDEFKA